MTGLDKEIAVFPLMQLVPADAIHEQLHHPPACRTSATVVGTQGRFAPALQDILEKNVREHGGPLGGQKVDC